MVLCRKGKPPYTYVVICVASGRLCFFTIFVPIKVGGFDKIIYTKDIIVCPLKKYI